MSRSATECLPDSVVALWPPPARVAVRWSKRDDETGYFVVPSMRNARLIVPIGVPGAERMLVRHAGGPLIRAGRSLWRHAASSRMSARLPVRRMCVQEEPGGIEHHLATELAQEIRIGVLLGPPRPNQKPVLQLFDGFGSTLAFAKVGVTPLAAELLAQETAALRLVTGVRRRTFEAPQVLSSESWRDLPVLVQRALPLAQLRLPPQEPPVTVIAEIAGVAGIAIGPLGASSLGAPVPVADRWFGLDLQPFERLRQRLSTHPSCPLGSWHGDFSPWNMASDGSTTQVWDWERFEQRVPVGLDAAHYRIQHAVASLQEHSIAWQLVTRDVGEVLTACGQAEQHADVVAGTYLVMICRRYVGDAVEGPTPELHRRISWLAGLSAVAAAALEKGKT